VKIVDDSNPSLDLGLRSEPEGEFSSVIQQTRCDLNLILNNLERINRQRQEALRRKLEEEREEKHALQDRVERQEKEIRELKQRMSKKSSLPTIPESSGNSAATQNHRSSLNSVKGKKTDVGQKDNGLGEERRTMLPKLQKTPTPRDDAATSEMATSRPGVAGVSLARSTCPPPVGHQRGVITERSHGPLHSDRSRATKSVSAISSRPLQPIRNSWKY